MSNDVPPPGPERDKLIARWVMRWKILRRPWSTDNAASLDVLGAMEEREWSWSLTLDLSAGVYEARFWQLRDEESYIGVDDSLAGAITAGALITVGACE